MPSRKRRPGNHVSFTRESQSRGNVDTTAIRPRLTRLIEFDTIDSRTIGDHVIRSREGEGRGRIERARGRLKVQTIREARYAALSSNKATK